MTSPETRPTLLVVDDDSTIRALLHTALQGSYDPLCVPNGAKVPGLVAARRPQLVILDINIPGSDSYALCQGIRTQAASDRLPILFMTVCKDDAAFFAELEQDGNAFIRKPFEMPALKARIAGLLRPRPAA